MQKIKLLFSFLVLGFFVLGSFTENNAQTVNIRRVAVSPSSLKGFPTGSWSNGLRIVGKGDPVYYLTDTTGAVTSFAWTVTNKPSGSNATFNSTSGSSAIFTPDVSGQYVVTVSVNGGKSSSDTIYASTFVGTSLTQDCAPCHTGDYKKFSSWVQTPHATIFKNGITGNLEITSYNGQTMGVYSDRCFKCHTVGYNLTADNGNFAFEAHKTGFDTSWHPTGTLVSGEYYIPSNDQTAWNLLTTNSKYSTVANMGTIGCENCHVPANQHKNGGFDVNGQYIAKTIDAGVCLKCHDGPTHHMIGAYYLASNHASLPNSAHANSTGCFPCHSGAAFVKYAKNQTNPGWTSADALAPISCAACHDPHEEANFGLRQVSVTLTNGYNVTSGGMGNICMTCHQSRSNVATKVTNQAPYYGFSDRFGPHHGPQTDMFFGQNAYDFGNSAIDGLMTHSAATDACVTCHMANIGPSSQPSHQWSMTDTTGGTPHDLVTACRNCHGSNINSFDDIKASSDWDGNGVIEGAQTEIEGLMSQLQAKLPADSKNPSVPVSMLYDSLLVKGQPNVIKGLYTYWFVSEDKSMGVHNAKYTVAILQAALRTLGSVVPVELTSLQAAYVNNAVTVSWETATETNNKGFEVQRKVNNDWTTIGFKPGNGSTTEISKYSFVDNLTDRPATNKLTYRLRQIDLDGSVHLSKEIEVTIVSGPTSYSVDQNYPNPFNPSTTIRYALPYESNVKIVVYNITGAVVSVLTNGVQSAGSHNVVLNTSSSKGQLSSGIYFYTIEARSLDGSHSFRETKKMILLK